MRGSEIAAEFEDDDGKHQEEGCPTEGETETEPYFVMFDSPAAIHNTSERFGRDRLREYVGHDAESMRHSLNWPQDP